MLAAIKTKPEIVNKFWVCHLFGDWHTNQINDHLRIWLVKIPTQFDKTIRNESCLGKKSIASAKFRS